MTLFTPGTRSLHELERPLRRRNVVRVVGSIAAIAFIVWGVSTALTTMTGICTVDGHRDCAVGLYEYGNQP